MTTERLTDEEFVAMCEHIEASTDLPWGRHRDEIMRLDTRPDAKHEFLCERVLAIQPWDDDHDPLGESQEEVDVALMLVAVNALPALLDEVEHLRTGNKYLTGRCEQLLNRAVTAEHDSLAIAAEREAIVAIVQAALESLADDPGNPITDDMERGSCNYGRVLLRMLLRDISARGESAEKYAADALTAAIKADRQATIDAVRGMRSCQCESGFNNAVHDLEELPRARMAEAAPEARFLSRWLKAGGDRYYTAAFCTEADEHSVTLVSPREIHTSNITGRGDTFELALDAAFAMLDAIGAA